MRCLLIVTMVSTLLLALLSVPTNAVTIFHDDVAVQTVTFEDDAVGGQPLGWSPKTNKPWSNNNVVMDAADPGPAHAASTKYLVLDRASNSNSDGRGYIDSWAPMSSGVAKASLMLYSPSTNNPGVAQIGFGGDLSDGLSVPIARKNGGVIEWRDGKDPASPSGAWAALDTETLTYETDVWQQWDLEIDLDTGIASICVAGNCSGDLDTGRVGVTISRLEIEAGWDGTAPHSKVYVDDVGAAVIPEPCTIVLLSMVAAMGLGFRRR